MTDFKCYLLDMDGTLYLGGKLIDGAAQAVAEMRRRGRVLFLTNNSSASRGSYALRLRALGIDAVKEDVFTAGNAAISLLNEQFAGQRVYLLGTDALKEEFREGGINLTENNPQVVVVGFDTSLTYDKLSKTCAFVRDGLPFIATHPDFNCPVLNGYIPDVGSFLALIEASSGRRPDFICGKPYPVMAKALKAAADFKADEAVVVGDRLYTDMQFAANNGFCSVLVLSGEADKESLEKSGLKVNRVIDSIADFFK